MARYIDADKLIAHLKDEIKECEIPFGSRANGKGVAYGTALGLKSAISFVETLPTADVVLRAELVTQTFKDAMRIASLQRRNGNLTALVKALITSTFTHKEEEAYNKGYADAKNEVAGEILTEIKAIMQFIALDYKEIGSFENAEIVGYVQDHLITELEKRYVEGEPIPASEEKHFSPEDVRNMTPQEVREKYTAIRRSMEMW